MVKSGWTSDNESWIRSYETVGEGRKRCDSGDNAPCPVTKESATVKATWFVRKRVSKSGRRSAGFVDCYYYHVVDEGKMYVTRTAKVSSIIT